MNPLFTEDTLKQILYETDNPATTFVCKCWNNLIKRPEFILSYLERHQVKLGIKNVFEKFNLIKEKTKELSSDESPTLKTITFMLLTEDRFNFSDKQKNFLSESDNIKNPFTFIALLKTQQQPSRTCYPPRKYIAPRQENVAPDPDCPLF